MSELEAQVLKVLRSCYDPEIPVNIYDLGLIYDIQIEPPGKVRVRMTLTAPNCPVAGSLPGEVKSKIAAIPGVEEAGDAADEIDALEAFRLAGETHRDKRPDCNGEQCHERQHTGGAAKRRQHQPKAEPRRRQKQSDDDKDGGERRPKPLPEQIPAGTGQRAGQQSVALRRSTHQSSLRGSLFGVGRG